MLFLSLSESILIYHINIEVTQQWVTWRSVYTTYLNACGGEGRCLKFQPGIFWQRRKPRKTDSHSLGRNFNLGSPEYGMQTTFFSSLLLLKCHLTALSSANITQRRMILTGNSRSTCKRSGRNATLYTKNPTQTGLGMNRGFCGDRPTTTCPSHTRSS
jgi:hypothetical protein